MFTMRDYKRVTSIEEAWEVLNQKNANVILGGTHFLKMGSKVIGTGIDLQDIGISYINEEEGFVKIGGTTTLREMEESKVLDRLYGKVFKEAFVGIVGTQLRNTATIGASVHGKYGFSDPCLIFLALEAKVNLYNEGIIPIEEYLDRPQAKDLVTEIIIPIKNQKVNYQSYRKTATDISVINVCVSIGDNEITRIAVGSRPMKAKLAMKAAKDFEINKNKESAGEIASKELSFGSNMRGSKEYRMMLTEILVKRALEEVM